MWAKCVNRDNTHTRMHTHAHTVWSVVLTQRASSVENKQKDSCPAIKFLLQTSGLQVQLEMLLLQAGKYLPPLLHPKLPNHPLIPQPLQLST